MNKYTGQGVLVFLLCLISAVSFAKPVTLSLIKLEQIQSDEKYGDELYLDIAVFKSGARASFKQLPKAPMHWSAAILPQLKLVPIWTGDLKSDQAVSFVVSLIEKDAPPWDLDDLLGSVKILIVNKAAQVNLIMSRPNHKEVLNNKAMKGDVVKTFIFDGGNKAKYKMTLMVSA